MTNTEWVWQYTRMEYSGWVTEYSTEHHMNPQHVVLAVHTKVGVGIYNADYG